MRFERLDLNLLVALDALIEERSVSQAANRLFLSQPALSGALNRLRDYFRDELLVQSGRQMILTPKAEELRHPVREALMFIRSRITTPSEFDYRTVERRFSLVASDYAFHVLIADVIREAATLAPGVSFDIASPDRLAMERLERGEVDLMLTISTHLPDTHPKQLVFEDDHAVISWKDGRHGAQLGHDAFFEAGHVVAVFGPERLPAFTEGFFASQGIPRRIELTLPSFSALPLAVIGTDRLATMYRRHAEYFASFLPLSVHAPPIALPTVREELMWHTLRSNDQGVKWLIQLIADTAARLPRAGAESVISQ